MPRPSPLLASSAFIAAEPVRTTNDTNQWFGVVANKSILMPEDECLANLLSGPQTGWHQPLRQYTGSQPSFQQFIASEPGSANSAPGLRICPMRGT